MPAFKTAAWSVAERAARYLNALPAAVAGQRGHDATFRAACVVIHGFALSEEVALRLFLVHFNPRCVPPWSETELRHKVQPAARSRSLRGHGYLLGGEAVMPLLKARPKPSLRWPRVNAEQREAITNRGLGLIDLWEASPVRLKGESVHAEDFVDALFPGNPLLCVGWSAERFATRPREEWRGQLASLSLVVPTFMTKRTGRTQGGKTSEHTLENTGTRRFVVCEFDAGTNDEQAAILWHLADFAPLAVVVHSGRRSLHGWFPVGDAEDGALVRFMRYAAVLGADPALFRNRSQFVRLPDGRRTDQGRERQRVYFWNPAALAGAGEGGEP